jgi:hypothetical protein
MTQAEIVPEPSESLVSATCERIAGLLGDLGGAFKRINECTFGAKRGSAVVAIHVEPDADETDTLVHVEANVVMGASLGAELLIQLLEFNDGSAWGAFGVDEEGTITVHHCLLGSSVSAETFPTVVIEVARIADDWDDVIIEQAGGKTAVEKLEDLKPKPKAQPTIEPPVQEEA